MQERSWPEVTDHLVRCRINHLYGLLVRRGRQAMEFLRNRLEESDLASVVHDVLLNHPSTLDRLKSMTDEQIVEEYTEELKLKLDSRVCSFARERCNRRKKFSPTDLEGSEDGQPIPVEAVLADERRHQVNDALLTLPERQYQATYLSAFERMPLTEIARVMGIKPSSASGLLDRARANLAKHFGFDGRDCWVKPSFWRDLWDRLNGTYELKRPRR